jgi:serine/threonine protein kinase
MNEQNGKNYQICSTLATGGTAVLYKAIQTSLDRPVIIKRLHSHLISDPNFTRRFELEAKAAASLDHENIVRIIDFGASEGNYHIVMEYIDGPSLKDVLTSRRFLGEELTLLIAHEICMGLDHAHHRGIIHRDVKPANIMITNEGQVKITDFGLAKLQQSQTQQTVASTLLGTPLYMSPEQAIGDTIDGRSDLFSLGTICYEAITGTQPFIGENYAAVIQNIIAGNVPAPSRFRKDIRPDAETIVMKALNREPGKRFRNALEMAHAIESLLGQATMLSARESIKRLVNGEDDLPATPEPPSRPQGRTKHLLSFGFAAAAVVGVFLVFALNPRSADHLVNMAKALRQAHPVPPEQSPAMGSQGEVLPGISMTLPEETLPVEPSTPDDQTPDSAASPGASAAIETGSQPAALVDSETTNEPSPQPSPSTESPEPADSAASAQAPRGGARKEVQAAGFLEIYVEPSSEIFVDGQRRLIGGHLGMLELPTGKHEIVCKSSGYHDYVESVQIQRGELSRRSIYLEEIAGGILFETETGAQVLIDGVYKGTIPLAAPITIAAGSHKVRLTKAGFKTWESSVYVPPDETVRLTISLLPFSSAQ